MNQEGQSQSNTSQTDSSPPPSPASNSTGSSNNIVSSQNNTTHSLVSSVPSSSQPLLPHSDPSASVSGPQSFPSQIAPSASASRQQRKIPVGTIAGCVIGGIVLLVCLLVYLLRRKHRRRSIEKRRATPEGVIPRPLVVSDRRRSRRRSHTADELSDTSTVILPSVIAIDDTPEKETLEEVEYSSTMAMWDQLQFFRAEMQVMRSRSVTNRPSKGGQAPSAASSPFRESTSNDASRSPSSAISKPSDPTGAIHSLANEIEELRAEMAQLKAQQQENITSPAEVVNPGTGHDLHREISLLRSEMEELRLQQSELDPLPEYTPPPPSFFGPFTSRGRSSSGTRG